MANARTLKTQGIVLKKTKLKEKDLILTLVAEDGSQVRCVAHGAQKPGSTFAARLELLSVADLLLHEGRNLYTVSEARTVESNEACRADIEHLSHGAVMAELISKTTLEGQEMPVIFKLTRAALASLGRARAELLPFVTAAFLIKAVAYLGYRPSFGECVICGQPADASGGGAFSIAAGGWVCADCAEFGEEAPDDAVDPATASWVKALLGLTFAQVEELDPGDPAAAQALATRLMGFCDRWIQEHLAVRLKTLGYLAQL